MPVVFDPVVVENYAGCTKSLPPWLVAAQKRDDDNPNLSMIVRGDVSYREQGGAQVR